jgi:hypothetical protein
METLAVILSYASGFALLRFPEKPPELLATSIAINLGLAPLTGVIARRRGRNSWLWTAIGLAFGMWALAAVLLIGRSGDGPETDPGAQYPPTSRAA